MIEEIIIKEKIKDIYSSSFSSDYSSKFFFKSILHHVISLEVYENNKIEGSKEDTLDKIKENPSDLDSKIEYSKILFNENNFAECIDVLLEMFRKDKEWKDGYAKKQLLLIFDHLGSENELSKKGRRALTSLIFVWITYGKIT